MSTVSGGYIGGRLLAQASLRQGRQLAHVSRRQQPGARSADSAAQVEGVHAASSLADYFRQHGNYLNRRACRRCRCRRGAARMLITLSCTRQCRRHPVGNAGGGVCPRRSTAAASPAGGRAWAGNPMLSIVPDVLGSLPARFLLFGIGAVRQHPTKHAVRIACCQAVPVLVGACGCCATRTAFSAIRRPAGRCQLPLAFFVGPQPAGSAVVVQDTTTRPAAAPTSYTSGKNRVRIVYKRSRALLTGLTLLWQCGAFPSSIGSSHGNRRAAGGATTRCSSRGASTRSRAATRNHVSSSPRWHPATAVLSCRESHDGVLGGEESADHPLPLAGGIREAVSARWGCCSVNRQRQLHRHRSHVSRSADGTVHSPTRRRYATTVAPRRQCGSFDLTRLVDDNGTPQRRCIS